MFTPEDIQLQLIYHLVKKEDLPLKVPNPFKEGQKKTLDKKLFEN
jgi:hypothetical protein